MLLALTHLWIGLAAYGAAPVVTAKPPSFDCVDADRVSYKIWIGKGKNLLRITDKGKTRELGLSGANLSRPVKEGQPLRYNGFNPKGNTIFTMLDGSTEFSTHYLVENGSSKVRVSLVVDSREKLGLVCQVSGVSTTVVALDKEVAAPERFLALLEEVAGLRTPAGLLKPIAVQRMEGIIRQLNLSPELKKAPERARFVELASPVVKSIDPRSTTLLGAKLRGPIGEFWKQLLEEMKVKYHPDYSRCSAWVKEGARTGIDRDLVSVIAGFNQFAASPGFKDKEIRDLFIGEVTESMKVLTEQDVHDAKHGLTKPALAFFEPLWVKVNGRKTLDDYVDVKSAAARLNQAVRSREFDPLKVHKAIGIAYKVLLPFEVEPKKLFKQAVSSNLRAMTARQREDLMGWLQEPAEKTFFLDLLR